jgi:hypothetical protein
MTYNRKDLKKENKDLSQIINNSISETYKKQSTYRISIDESKLQYEPQSKVDAFSQRLKESMTPVIRETKKKLALSYERAKKIKVK